MDMKFTRRDFLKAMAISAAMFTAGCGTKRDTHKGPVDQKDAEKWVKGVCRYCGTGCGVLAGVTGGKIVAVKGDPDCAVNKGRLCVKGILLPKIMNTPDRLLTLEQVSFGTMNQVYFAMRITAADLLSGGARIPIILDEPFAMYDEERLEKALRYLSGLPRQVILFSCQTRELDLLSSIRRR
jgi:hypothetical protein